MELSVRMLMDCQFTIHINRGLGDARLKQIQRRTLTDIINQDTKYLKVETRTNMAINDSSTVQPDYTSTFKSIAQ